MFILNNNDKNPLYKQLYHQIRARALSGKLPADFKLQSVRTLADELSTSRNTVATAYQELSAEGYVYSKPRSGYFVSALDQDMETLRESSMQLVRYGDPQGEWELRCLIQLYLERSRDVVCDPEQIVVCAGVKSIVINLPEEKVQF